MHMHILKFEEKVASSFPCKCCCLLLAPMLENIKLVFPFLKVSAMFKSPVKKKAADELN